MLGDGNKKEPECGSDDVAVTKCGKHPTAVNHHEILLIDNLADQICRETLVAAVLSAVPEPCTSQLLLGTLRLLTNKVAVNSTRLKVAVEVR